MGGWGLFEGVGIYVRNHLGGGGIYKGGSIKSL